MSEHPTVKLASRANANPHHSGQGTARYAAAVNSLHAAWVAESGEWRRARRQASQRQKQRTRRARRARRIISVKERLATAIEGRNWWTWGWRRSSQPHNREVGGLPPRPCPRLTRPVHRKGGYHMQRHLRVAKYRHQQRHTPSKRADASRERGGAGGYFSARPKTWCVCARRGASNPSRMVEYVTFALR